MGDKISGNIKEGLNEKKPMYEKLKEKLQNHECAPAEKELMGEALEAISMLESTVFATLDVLKESRNQRDKAFEALIKTTKLQYEVEEELLEAKKALVKLSTSQCFAGNEVFGMSLSKDPLGREILARMKFASEIHARMKFASEILEELEGYKE